MSLQFYLGGSGTGKSTQLYKDVNEWAKKDRDRNFLFLVPDQYTMQAQLELVRNSPSKGIMNVDVLSFSRLAHRVFEETGYMNNKRVLDDTGKSLVLRAVASSVKDDLTVLSGNLDKIGYIHEIKSVISEFKQYDITPEKTDVLLDASQTRGMLQAKLHDIKLIYNAFNSYISNDYITSEETISLLTDAVTHSEIIKGSVVILDGFTGFTPVQYRLIQRLLELTSKVIISITVDIKSDPYKIKGEQELFCLSKKTILNLQKLSQEINVVQDEDVLFENALRFNKSPEMEHLMQHIFRYPVIPYKEEVKSINLTECDNIENEIRDVCFKIRSLALSGECLYKDMAVVVADPDSYCDIFEDMGRIYGIPFFIDRNHKLMLNPFTEFIKSVLYILKEDFSYRSVFHFLKSGLTGISALDIDEFDNYILANGIKGKKAYLNPIKEDDPDSMIESIRSRFVLMLDPLLKEHKTASDHCRALLEFIDINEIEDKLLKMKEDFESEGNREKASEFGQVGARIVDLIGQIDDLLGDSPIGLDEFIKTLEAGIEEIDIGSIPAGVDRVMVGDITRSRTSDIKVMFLMGANDGNIPMANSRGGIISDMDREFLKEKDIELSPTPREQIYTQRFYLYTIMSKPSMRLDVSYSRTGNDGKALKESYLIRTIKDLFPAIQVSAVTGNERCFDKITGYEDAIKYYSDAVREYSYDGHSLMSNDELAATGALLKNNNDSCEKAETIENAAFFEYGHDPMPKELAKLIYGSVLTNSVSRLEQLAACQYAHFLRYGMRLQERDEFSFERSDLGTVYHEILKCYSDAIAKKGYAWNDVPEDVSRNALDETVEDVCATYGKTILYSSYSKKNTVERIRRIMTRTVKTIKEQLSSGSFVPEGFETDFSREIKLPDDTVMKIKGRIDRIDICKKDDKLFVKIIDYKSGNKDIDLSSLLYGLQIQQPVYMSETLRQLSVRYPDSIPVMAAMLYYHIDDPILSKADPGTPDEEIEEDILSLLRPKGLLSNNREIIECLDGSLSGDAGSVTSRVIPAGTLKSGELSSKSKVISQDNYLVLSNYTDLLIKRLAEMIISGQKAAEPAVLGDRDPCVYCSFKEVCIYDEKCPGFKVKELEKLSNEEAIERMRAECQ
ncbi:MAG: PD-(D/E)XK nuclease family protein [Lachnospiraceae bacterium]|nr:PD-(D/E)XK nuclease family protein [Lachnospiraceae bacterium]